MSRLDRSPLLPWDVIENIIGANWIKPTDLAARTTLNLVATSFDARYAGLQKNRKDVVPWLRVSKETSVIASRLYYSCMAFSSFDSLVNFRMLLQNPSTSQSFGSLVRYLSVAKLPNEMEDEQDASGWSKEMRQVARLLPNLDVFRAAGGEVDGEDAIVAELLTSPSTLRVISYLPLRSSNLSTLLSLLDRSSSTLQFLGVQVKVATDEPIHDPSTYPLITFPSLAKISLTHELDQYDTLLLPIMTSRWDLPALYSLQTFASPSLLPFLKTHGHKIRELVLWEQGIEDDGSYEGWFKLCPNTETLALQVWDWVDGEEGVDTKPVAFDIQEPVLSIRTITIDQVFWNAGEVPASDSGGEKDLQRMITKANFPSLERVVFSSDSHLISKSILAWSRTLARQGVVFECN